MRTWRGVFAITCSAFLVCGALAASVSAPRAHAGFGDTHVTGEGIQETLDCNDSTLFVMGTKNFITTTGTCYAVTVQGSFNVVIADTVTNDITVYGYDETVLYKNGDPVITDVGRQLQMTNRIDRV